MTQALRAITSRFVVRVTCACSFIVFELKPLSVTFYLLIYERLIESAVPETPLCCTLLTLSRRIYFIREA